MERFKILQKTDTPQKPTSGKSNYRVPAFLSYLTTDELTDEEFTTSYAPPSGDVGDVPLWWRRDVALSLSGIEKRKELKRQTAFNRYLESNLEMQQKQNERFESTVYKQEREFKLKLDGNSELLAAKERELELTASENLIRAERDRLDAEARKKAAELAKAETELALANEEQLRRRQLILLSKIDVAREKIDETEAEIVRLNEERERLRLEYLAVKRENDKRAEEYPMLPKSQPVPETFVGQSEDKVSEQPVVTALPVQKVYESYDKNNALEIRDLLVVERATGLPVIENLTLNVKRNGVTVAYTAQEERLTLFRQILFKSYSSEYRLMKGVLRIEGKDAFSVGRSDYKKFFGEDLLSFDNEADRLYHARGKLKDAFRGRKLGSNFEDNVVSFGLPADITSTKMKELTSEQIRLVSLASVLCGTEIAVLEQPEVKFDKKTLAAITEKLSTLKNKTVLVLTSDLSFLNSITGARVYKI